MMHNPARKVLLVDDDRVYRERLEDVLRQRGFETCSAADGASGLLAAHAQQPDLIVVDAELPVMTGYQMVEVLRSNPHTEKMWVILLTRDQEDAIARGWMNGADICLSRGAGMADLLLMIERALPPGPGALSLAS
jgi:DNA-binding response OmpR family regulator